MASIPKSSKKSGGFSLKLKLILVLLPSLGGMIYFAATRVVEKTSEAAALEQVVQISNLAENIGQFVHEAQKERGRSLRGHLSAAG